MKVLLSFFIGLFLLTNRAFAYTSSSCVCACGGPEINPTSMIGAFVVVAGGAFLVWETLRRRKRRQLPE